MAIIDNNEGRLQVKSIFSTVLFRNAQVRPYGSLTSAFGRHVDAYFYWAEPESEIHDWLRCNALPWYSAFEQIDWTPIELGRPNQKNTWCPDNDLHKFDKPACSLCNLHNSLLALGTRQFMKRYITTPKYHERPKLGYAQFFIECGIAKKNIWRLPSRVPSKKSKRLDAICIHRAGNRQ